MPARTKRSLEFHWNYRIVRRRFRRKYSSETLYQVHEAHYYPGRKTVPNLITIDPVDAHGGNKKELKESLERMLRALDKPVLEYTTYIKPQKKVKKKFCCNDFETAVMFKCPLHTPQQCPDTPIVKTKTGWGLSIKDGACSHLVISHCPWCGSRLK